MEDTDSRTLMLPTRDEVDGGIADICIGGSGTCLGGFGSAADRVCNRVGPTKILQRDERTFPRFLPIKIEIRLSLLSFSSFFSFSLWSSFSLAFASPLSTTMLLREDVPFKRLKTEVLRGGGITGAKPDSKSSELFMVDLDAEVEIEADEM